MATTLVWTTVGEVTEGKVGNATNKAFTIKQTDSTNAPYQLISHITGKETEGGAFDTLAKAKLEADEILVANNIPQTGTVTAG